MTCKLSINFEILTISEMIKHEAVIIVHHNIHVLIMAFDEQYSQIIVVTNELIAHNIFDK